MNKWSVYVCLYVFVIAIIGLIYFKIQDWREQKRQNNRQHTMFDKELWMDPTVQICLWLLAFALIGGAYFQFQDWWERKKERERDHRDDD